MSLSQATYRLFLPCDSRKSCFTARFTLSSQCHLFGFHPAPSLLSATNAKLCEHLQLPLCLPPTSAVPQGPQHPLCSHSSWCHLCPVARALVHCFSWNCSCTKEREARGCQHPNHRGCTAAAQEEPAQAQPGSSPETAGRRHQRSLGSRVAAEPSIGTELRGSSATAQHRGMTYHMFLPSKRTN